MPYDPGWPGYVLRVRENGQRMFKTRVGDVHVHIWTYGGGEIERELAARDWNDRNDYAEAKSDVIAAILSRAQSAQSPGC